MSTIVKTIANAPIHGRTGESSKPYIPKESHLRKRSFKIAIGKPKKPGPQYQCDTDVIWPVLWAEEIGEIDPSEFGGVRPYVCRHQIEAGD